MLHLFTRQMMRVGLDPYGNELLMLGNDSIETSPEVSIIAFSASRDSATSSTSGGYD